MTFSSRTLFVSPVKYTHCHGAVVSISKFSLVQVANWEKLLILSSVKEHSSKCLHLQGKLAVTKFAHVDKVDF